jgi:hypothetical protein
VALIKCAECGRDISDQARTCPGCGIPLEPESTEQAEVPGGSSKSESSPAMGIVAIGLALASVIMPYFAAVFFVPAAFVCGIIAVHQGRKGLGGVSILIAIAGLIGIFSVSQRIADAQKDLEKAVQQLKGPERALTGREQALTTRICTQPNPPVEWCAKNAH